MPYHYVYLLVSIAHPQRHYVGLTEDMRLRLRKHNAGEVNHTAKYRPWAVNVVIAFRDRDRAAAFERYLKSHSGRAFSQRHF